MKSKGKIRPPKGVVTRPWYEFGWGVILIIFDLLQAVLPYWLKTDNSIAEMRFFYVCVIIIAGVDVIIFLDFATWRIEYTKDKIILHSWYRGAVVYFVAEIENVIAYYSMPQQRMAFLVCFSNGARLGINKSYRGNNNFISFLRQMHVPFRNC